jgi:hypothetical protein
MKMTPRIVRNPCGCVYEYSEASNGDTNKTYEHTCKDHLNAALIRIEEMFGR